MTKYETLVSETNEHITLITLNRPEKLNAFNGQMAVELKTVLAELADDPNTKVVIFTGAGRAYCAGADLSDRGGETFARERSAHPNDSGAGIPPDTGGQVTLKIYDFPKPIICAVNGAAVGVGVTMQLPMDIRIASKNAKFGFVFNRRGITPEACSSWFLPRLVGISKALEWCYTGRPFSAEEAMQSGLVSEVVDSADLLPRCLQLAKEIVDNTAPVSNAITRQMMWKMLGSDHPVEGHIVESRSLFYRGRSKDAKEGVSSFLEKRPAKFSDSIDADMPEFYPWWEEKKYQ